MHWLWIIWNCVPWPLARISCIEKIKSGQSNSGPIAGLSIFSIFLQICSTKLYFVIGFWKRIASTSQDSSRQYYIVHGLCVQASFDDCDPMVWRLVTIPTYPCNWDTIRTDSTDWHCPSDCTRNGLSTRQKHYPPWSEIEQYVIRASVPNILSIFFSPLLLNRFRHFSTQRFYSENWWFWFGHCKITLARLQSIEPTNRLVAVDGARNNPNERSKSIQLSKWRVCIWNRSVRDGH